MEVGGGYRKCRRSNKEDEFYQHDDPLHKRQETCLEEDCAQLVTKESVKNEQQKSTKSTINKKVKLPRIGQLFPMIKMQFAD